MVTLFDQEKIWEIHDYNVAQAARQEAREEAIRIMVSTLQRLSCSKDVIAETLSEEYGLSAQDAADLVERHWA